MSDINKADRGAIFSRLFGNNIQRARQHVAAAMIWLGVSPNTLTVLGMLTTFGAGACLALGAGDKVGSAATGAGYSWWGFAAGMGIILASAFDILDGAVAKTGGRITKQGGFLDSCLDRVADAVIFIGIMIYFLRNPGIQGADLFVIASAVALVNAEIISYIKARAENFIESCPVGYWQRGERIAGILIGLFSGHIATVMVLLAVSSAFTVLRRLVFAARQIKRMENNEPLLETRPALTGIYKLALWRYRRGTVGYDVITAVNILIILLVDLQRGGS